jgi:hypothetical protein
VALAKRHTLKRASGIAGIISAAMLLTVTQATAAAGETDLATDPNGPSHPISLMTCANYGGMAPNMKAQACFIDEGDWFELYDGKADGYSAAVDWETEDGRWGAIFNASGAGTTRFKNKNFAEAQTIRFRACLGDWSVRMITGYCGPWTSDVT